jgi:hypothetical protein
MVVTLDRHRLAAELASILMICLNDPDACILTGQWLHLEGALERGKVVAQLG